MRERFKILIKWAYVIWKQLEKNASKKIIIVYEYENTLKRMKQEDMTLWELEYKKNKKRNMKKE